MTRFEKWVKDTDISIQLQVAFICKHYDGNCENCFLNHICTNDKKVHEYLNADSKSEYYQAFVGAESEDKNETDN